MMSADYLGAARAPRCAAQANKRIRVTPGFARNDHGQLRYTPSSRSHFIQKQNSASMWKAGHNLQRRPEVDAPSTADAVKNPTEHPKAIPEQRHGVLA